VLGLEVSPEGYSLHPKCTVLYRVFLTMEKVLVEAADITHV
jgi:hypothetical protein